MPLPLGHPAAGRHGLPMWARGLLAALLLVCGSSSAWGLPAPRAHLIYLREAGADRCPDEEAVRQAVAARLGYDPFSPQAPRTITVAVRGQGGGLTARIELSDEAGELTGRQKLTSPHRHCGDLAPALALAIALAIDPLSAIRGDGPSASDAASPPDGGQPEPPVPLPSPPVIPIEPPAPPRPPPPPPPSARERTRLLAGVGAMLALGSAPAPTAGFMVRLGLRESAWSVGLEVRGDLPVSGSFAGGEVTTWLLAGSLVPCLQIALRRRLEIAACGLLVAGAQFGQGRGFGSDLAPTDPIVLAGLRGGLEVPLRGRFSLLVHGDLLASVVTPRLKVGQEVVWRTSPVGGTVGAALLIAVR